MPNNEEILLLLLFSPVCQVEQSGKVKNNVFHNSPKIIADFIANDNSSQGLCYDVDKSDWENNNFIIEKECSINFVSVQPDNSFAFPNGMDVLDDPDNNNSIDIGPDVENAIIVGDNKYGVVCDKSNDATPLPLPPESSTYNIIMLCTHLTNITNNGLVYQVEQSDEMNILIDGKVNILIEEVNEKYPLWRPHRAEKYLDELEHHKGLSLVPTTTMVIVSTEIVLTNNPIGNKTKSSTTTTAPVFCMELVSNEEIT